MGFIHIYCGDGKGKTTAALGLALRASGAGYKIHIVQFLKGNDTSELESIKLLKNISVDRPKKNYGFTKNLSEADRAELTSCHNKMLENAYEKMNSHEIDMLILDEFFAAYNKNLIDKALAERLVFDFDGRTELVLTGRDPQEKFIETADYVSEIISRKHPFEKGIKARKGIEY